MRKMPCLREWRGGSAYLYSINFGTVDAPTRKKRFSAGRRPAGLLRGQPFWAQASSRDPRRPRFHRPPGIAECQGRFTGYIDFADRQAATLAERPTFQSTRRERKMVRAREITADSIHDFSPPPPYNIVLDIRDLTD
jgi:hypothetical protein